MSGTSSKLGLLVPFLLFALWFCWSVYLGNDNAQIEDRIYVIPGGGPGKDGYPEWTRRRTLAAVASYNELNSLEQSNAVFLALSAGSFNVGSRMDADGKIIFECQATMKHLFELGIPDGRVFGDFLSWDTVTNALTLRLFVEGTTAAGRIGSHSPVHVEVYISDFHANRVKAAFDWVMNLEPRLARPFTISIHEVDSNGLFEESDMAKRRAHEVAGVNQILGNAKIIETTAQLYNFLFMDGHKGISNYMKGEYKATSAVGY
jgi:hypothetical protein